MSDALGSTAGDGGIAFIRDLVSLYREGATGVLEVDGPGDVVLQVFIEEGRPIFAEAGTLGDSLGRVLLSEGMLTPDQYAGVVRKMTETLVDSEALRFGEQAIALGYLSADDIRVALGQQVRRKIVSCMQWMTLDRGFDADPSALEGIDRYPCDPHPLVFDGLRRYFDAERLAPIMERWRDQYLSLDAAPAKIGERCRLHADELDMVESIDGQHTVGEVLQHPIGPHRGAMVIAGVVLSGQASLHVAVRPNSDRSLRSKPQSGTEQPGTARPDTVPAPPAALADLLDDGPLFVPMSLAPSAALSASTIDQLGAPEGGLPPPESIPAGGLADALEPDEAPEKEVLTSEFAEAFVARFSSPEAEAEAEPDAPDVTAGPGTPGSGPDTVSDPSTRPPPHRQRGSKPGDPADPADPAAPDAPDEEGEPSPPTATPPTAVPPRRAAKPVAPPTAVPPGRRRGGAATAVPPGRARKSARREADTVAPTGRAASPPVAPPAEPTSAPPPPPPEETDDEWSWDDFQEAEAAEAEAAEAKGEVEAGPGPGDTQDSEHQTKAAKRTALAAARRRAKQLARLGRRPKPEVPAGGPETHAGPPRRSRKRKLRESQILRKKRILAEKEFRAAREHIERQEWPAAERELRRAIEHEPGQVEYALHLAWVKFRAARAPSEKKSQRELLEATLTEAFRHDRRMPFAHYVAGQLALLDEDDESAWKSLRNAMLLDPSLRDAERCFRLIDMRTVKADWRKELEKKKK